MEWREYPLGYDRNAMEGNRLEMSYLITKTNRIQEYSYYFLSLRVFV
jgi:hypothetical protein